MRYEKSINKENVLLKFVKVILFGSLFGAIVCTMLLLLFSFLFVSVKSIPLPMIQWLVIFCAGMGAFVAGFVSTKLHQSKGLICGSLSALLLFLIITLVAFIISRDKFTYITIIRLLAMLVFGAVGGLLGVGKKRRK